MAGCGAGETALATYRDALNFACDQAGAHGIDILIEALNPIDAPCYLVNDFALAQSVIENLKRPHLKLQFDMYHRHILHREVAGGLEDLSATTAHLTHLVSPC